MSGSSGTCTFGSFDPFNSACWANDESHLILQSLIGFNADNVLGDTGSLPLVMNKVLYYFNTVMLSGAFFIFAFILVAGVIYTAQDGTFLGKKWASAWIPLRAIFGALMLVPNAASGFCFAQYIMLLLTYVGISMGSYVWQNVTADIASNPALSPVQDMTARLEAMNRLGKYSLNLLVQQRIQNLLTSLDASANSQVAVTRDSSGAMRSVKVRIQDVIPMDLTWVAAPPPATSTGAFARTQSLFKTFFADAIPAATTLDHYGYNGRQAGGGTFRGGWDACPSSTHCTAGSRMQIPALARTAYTDMITGTTRSLFTAAPVPAPTGSSTSAQSSGGFYQAYFGMQQAQDLLGNVGTCSTARLGGNCVNFVNADLELTYTVAPLLGNTFNASSTGSVTQTPSTPYRSSLANLLINTFFSQAGVSSVMSRLRNAGTTGQSGCYNLRQNAEQRFFAVPISPNCVFDNTALRTVEPTFQSTQELERVNPYYAAVSAVINRLNTVLGSGTSRDQFFQALGLTGTQNLTPQMRRFLTDQSATSVPGAPVSGPGACGSVDFSRIPTACTGSNDTTECRQREYRRQAFGNGGWWCAGNRYLALDDLLSQNLMLVRAVSKLLATLNPDLLPMSVNPNANGNTTFTYFNYAKFDLVPSTTAIGASRLVASANGADATTPGPPVILKLTASTTGTTQFSPTIVTWDELLGFSRTDEVTGVTAPVDGLIRQSVRLASYCSGLDAAACARARAFGNHLEDLLKSLRAQSENQAVIDPIQALLTLRSYGVVSRATGPFTLNAASTIDPATAEFLVNLIEFGIRNGFLSTANRIRIPGNLPSPPVNPITASDNALEQVFENLLGGQNSIAGGSEWSEWTDTEFQNNQATYTGWIRLIYNLGISCEEVRRRAEAAGRPISLSSTVTGCTGTNPNVVDEQFSMIKQMQVAGMGIMSGVLSALSMTFRKFQTQVTNMGRHFQDKFEDLAYKSAAAAPLGGIGDMIGGATNSFGSIAMARLQAQMMIAFAQIGLQLAWLPVLLFVMTTAFSAAIGFAIMIPLMPFMLFWSGKVAWLLLFFESLLAAPLMALGIMYPDGHDIWGQSEPGVKLAVSMIMMPVLMVAGLLLGIALTYVVIDFTAIAFRTVMDSILTTTAQVSTQTNQAVAASNVTAVQGVISLILTFSYAYILVLAFEKCFSGIYVFPEKVMQWIGIQGQKFGEQDAQQFKQQGQQMAKEGAQAGGQSATQSFQAAEQTGKAQGEGGAKVGEAWVGASQRASQQVQGWAQSGSR